MSTELIGVFIAASSLIIGWILGTRSERIATEQYRLDAVSFASSWYTDLRAWAAEAIELLSETIERSQTEQSNSETMATCRYKLSALIDRGRFFLPNKEHNSYGTNKPEAYRGIRHPALDYLVGAYQIIDETVPVEDFGYRDKKGALIDIKRQFVSSIQVVLDPRLHIRQINQLLEASRSETLEKESPIERLLLSKLRNRK